MGQVAVRITGETESGKAYSATVATAPKRMAAAISGITLKEIFLPKSAITKDADGKPLIDATGNALSESWGLRGKVIRPLIEGGASLDPKSDMGRTPLHLAAMGGHVGVARVLCELGAETEERDADGMTPADLLESGQLDGKIKRAIGFFLATYGMTTDADEDGADQERMGRLLADIDAADAVPAGPTAGFGR